MRKNRLPARSPSSAAPDEDLTSLRDIGAASAHWLQTVGIHTVSDLRRIGPAAAYGQVRFRFGRAVNRNFLYAMAMGLQGRPYNDATPAEKQRLCADAGIAWSARSAEKS
jgi:hypothetical protein